MPILLRGKICNHNETEVQIACLRIFMKEKDQYFYEKCLLVSNRDTDVYDDVGEGMMLKYIFICKPLISQLYIYVYI